LRGAGLLTGVPPPDPPAPRARADTPATVRVSTYRPASMRGGAQSRCGYRALDHAFRVRTDDPEVAAQVAAALADLACPRPGRFAVAVYTVRRERAGWVVAVAGEPVAAPVTRERVVRVLLWHVNAEAVRRSAHRSVLLHAAVAERDGAAVVLPAGTDRGKTTTVAGLVRAGYRYLSDEVAAFDPGTLELRPYPKPLGRDPRALAVLAYLRPRAA